MGPTAGLGVLESDELLVSVGVQTLWRPTHYLVPSPTTLARLPLYCTRFCLEILFKSREKGLPVTSANTGGHKWWPEALHSKTGSFRLLCHNLWSTKQNINLWRADVFPVGDVTSAFRTLLMIAVSCSTWLAPISRSATGSQVSSCSHFTAMCRMCSLYFETIHVPCFVSAVSLLRRLYFATKVRHVQRFQPVVCISRSLRWKGHTLETTAMIPWKPFSLQSILFYCPLLN